MNALFGVLFSTIAYSIVNKNIGQYGLSEFMQNIILYSIPSIIGFFVYKFSQINKINVFWFLVKIAVVQAVCFSLIKLGLETAGVDMNFKMITYGTLIFSLVFNFNKFGLKIIKKMVMGILGIIFSKKKMKIGKDDLDIVFIDQLGNNGRDFEDYVATLYRSGGFNAKTTTELKNEGNLPDSVMRTAGNGEQGVDVIVFFETNQEIDGEIFSGLLIQCKHYKNTVGNKAIQEIYTAVPMYSKHYNRKFKPIVYTNNFFTKPAKNLAESSGVGLIDRDVLPLVLNEIRNFVA